MSAGSKQTSRCHWAKSPLMIEYHDQEWGVPVHDDRKLFEFLDPRGRAGRIELGNDPQEARKLSARRSISLILQEDCSIRPPEGARAHGQSWNRAKSFENRGDDHECAGISGRAKGIRNLRSLHLAVRSRAFSEAVAGDFRAATHSNHRIRRDEQGSKEARFSFCRLDDLLCVHAGGGHGQRPCAGLFSLKALNSKPSLCGHACFQGGRSVGFRIGVCGISPPVAFQD